MQCRASVVAGSTQASTLEASWGVIWRVALRIWPLALCIYAILTFNLYAREYCICVSDI